jgi:hypothetical protein
MKRCVMEAMAYAFTDARRFALLVLNFRLGSAVAVERVFSGGRDTISLRRASLHSDTIRVLMLVKKKIQLARAKTID